MTLHILEGEWSGYSSTQRRVVHREVVSELRAQKLGKVSAIRFTDGTSLILSLRPKKRGETVQPSLGYSALIHEAERAGQPIFVIEAEKAAP